MNIHDRTYFRVIEEVLKKTDTHRPDRTAVGTYSYFGLTARYHTYDGFPLLISKKVHWKSVVGELLWFLSGSTNNNELQNKYGVTIWNEWADGDGELGPIYGKQWRDFNGVDQITQLIENIKKDPYSRRHVVSAWNPNDLPDMALAPCHTLFQVYIHTDGKLDLQLYQRSADLFLGVPFNIASYSLLMHMIAHVTGYKPGTFIHTIGDAHIYKNHMDALNTQLDRPLDRKSPTIELNPNIDNIFNFTPDDIKLIGYNPYPTIKAPVAV